MPDITIGNPAISGLGLDGYGYTAVDRFNPANATGIITNIEIYSSETIMTNVKIATFYVVSGDNLSTRDIEVIGEVPAGYHNYSVNLNVQAGDYLGIYRDGYGDVDFTFVSEGLGHWSFFGDNIPCINSTFAVITEWKISVMGTGIIPSPINYLGFYNKD